MPAKAPSGCVFSCEWRRDRRDQPDSNIHHRVESFVNMVAEVGGRLGRGGGDAWYEEVREVCLFRSIVMKQYIIANVRRIKCDVGPCVYSYGFI